MRWITPAFLLGTLAACSPGIPDSAAGVGFDNSIAAQRAREAAVTGSALPPPDAVSSERLPAAPGTPSQASPEAATPGAPLAGTAFTSLPPATAAPSPDQQDAILNAASSLDAAAANSGVPPVEASPSNPPPMQINGAGLSDENDFAAVSERESIASDAERLAQNRAQYQVVAPTALPSRTNAAQPNIVQYALSTNHAKGTKVHRRLGLNIGGRSARNCAAYASADQAQIDFLSRGGPQRDRLGLDPDGDGFACNWDPRPFRMAVKNRTPEGTQN